MSKQKSRNKEAARSDTAFAFTDEAWEDYLHWQQADRKVLRNINDLLEECRRDSFRGTGRPEPLVGNLSGFWSRRCRGGRMCRLCSP
jgi:toxin YoeB